MVYEPVVIKQTYIYRGFKEMSISCSPDNINNLSNNMKRKRKRHGSKNHISGTIYLVLGYMSASIATCVSLNDQNYHNWDKVRISEYISIPKLPHNKLFDGINKQLWMLW